MEYPQELIAFAADHCECACCGIPEHRARYDRWPGLQTHHLVKRSRRVCHEPWNLLRLCARCHQLAELECVRVDGVPLPKLTFAICLGIKRECASEYQSANEWEPEKLADLYCRALPEIEPLPECFVIDRQRYKPYTPWSELVC